MCSAAASSSTTACVSWRPCGLSAITRLARRAGVHRLERSGDHVDAQHHPGAPAVGLIVDLPVPQRCVVAIGEEP